MPVTSYSRTPASNNAAPPNGAPEGMTPGSVNDTIRQIMTDVVNEAAKGQAKVLSSVAGTNTITASMSPALDAYSAGMIVVFTPAGNNTGATTLNINSLGALDVFRQTGVALASGDLVSGVPAVLVLDSGADDWILLNPTSLATLEVTTSLTYGGIEVGYRTLPNRSISATGSSTSTDAGKMIALTGASAGQTLTMTSIGDKGIVTVINIASQTWTIAGATSMNWLNGSGAISTGNRTIGIGGVATIWCVSGNDFYIWGTGIT